MEELKAQLEARVSTVSVHDAAATAQADTAASPEKVDSLAKDNKRLEDCVASLDLQLEQTQQFCKSSLSGRCCLQLRCIESF